MNDFLNKITPIIGKHFRILCIIGFPTFVLYYGWNIFFDYNKIKLGGLIIGIWIFLVIAVIFQIYYLLGLKKEKYKPEYETWGSYFYLIIFGALIYFLAKFLYYQIEIKFPEIIYVTKTLVENNGALIFILIFVFFSFLYKQALHFFRWSIKKIFKK